MKLISHKEAKVISQKYSYRTDRDNWVKEYSEHKDEMERDGFKETNSKYAGGNQRVSTYVKYTSL